MEKQRLSRQAALVKQLDCGCGDAACADGKTCTHPVMRRTGILKSVSEKRSNDAYSTQHSGPNGTPNVVVASKVSRGKGNVGQVKPTFLLAALFTLV